MSEQLSPSDREPSQAATAVNTAEGSSKDDETLLLAGLRGGVSGRLLSHKALPV